LKKKRSKDDFDGERKRMKRQTDETFVASERHKCKRIEQEREREREELKSSKKCLTSLCFAGPRKTKQEIKENWRKV
jgi:hypothetical protein